MLKNAPKGSGRLKVTVQFSSSGTTVLLMNSHAAWSPISSAMSSMAYWPVKGSNTTQAGPPARSWIIVRHQA
jgi:hypothetical protein